MGLLEKAMQYKRELNRKGEETLMDRIQGPADGQMPGEGAETEAISERVNDVVVLSKEDLVEVPGNGTEEPAIADAAADDQVEKVLSEELEEVPAAGEKEPELTEAPEPKEGKAGPRLVVPPQYEGSFKDYLVLYETGREIIRSGSVQELFDTLIFLIMGQIAVSSVSIMIPDVEQDNRWIIAESRGVSLDKDFSFDSGRGILGEFRDRGDILDVEAYSGDEKFKEDYLSFISIDARMLVPMNYGETMVGIIVIGNKISNEDFTDEDRDYLHSVSQFSAVAYYTLTNKFMAEKEVASLRREITGMGDLAKVRDEVFASETLEEARSVVRREMEKAGVEMYAFYIINEFNNRFVPVLTEEKDYFGLTESQRAIDVKNGLVQFIARAAGPVDMEDYASTDAVAEIFSRAEIKRMSMLRIFPFRLGDSFVGFLVVFHLTSEAKREALDSRLDRITDIFYPFAIGLDSVRYTKQKYVDTVERTLSRIEEEIRKVKKIGIPLTLVELSIKNFKRHYTQYGIQKSRELMAGIESLVKTKLSDADFSVRHDRNKVLIVLPGKSRDFAVPLSNALKNEIIHSFSTREVQLLVTFLAAEYPKDGDNVYALIDTIE